ncbi:MAG: hypothetical protein AB2L14_01000 [Candidatus Xenobiia bacterium LiM19]
MQDVFLRSQDKNPDFSYTVLENEGIRFNVVQNNDAFQTLVLKAIDELERKGIKPRRKYILDQLLPDTTKCPATADKIKQRIELYKCEDTEKMYMYLKRLSYNQSLVSARSPMNGLGVLDSMVEAGSLRQERVHSKLSYYYLSEHAKKESR